MLMIVLKLSVKKLLRYFRKDQYVTFKNYERKIKSFFIIYADFESTLISEDNKKAKSR